MKKEYILLIIVAVVLIGGIVFAQSRQLSNQTAPTPAVEVEDDRDELEDADDIDEVEDDIDDIDEEADESSPTTKTKTGVTSATSENVKSFKVEGENFSFSLKEIRVKKGDTVEIVFINKKGFHDWTIYEFNAKTKQINTGESETIRFVADKAGSFEYYCSVGTHRQQGMVGTLIVE